MKEPATWGLRARLVALVFLGLAPVFGLLLYATLSSRGRAVEAGKREALQAARSVANRQQMAFHDAALVLSLIARSPIIAKGTPEECVALLGDMLRQQPLFANAGIVRGDGTFRASVLPVPDGINATDRSWFQRALRTGAFAVGEFQVGRITGRASINAAVPVAGPGGDQEVLFVALDLASLHAEATRTLLPEGADLTLFDRNGTVLVTLPENPMQLGRTLPSGPITAQGLSVAGGTAEGEDVHGTRRLFGYAPLRADGQEAVAFLRVGLPEERVAAAADRALRWTLASAVVLAVMALGAAWAFGNLLVVRHVRKLEEAADRLKKGDPAVRCGPPYGPGEIGGLERTFDEMAEALAEERSGRGRAEASLREREDLFHQMAESVEQVFWVTEPGANPFRYVSPAFERIFGFPPLRLFNEPSLWTEAIHPADRKRVSEAITRHEEAGRYEESYRIVRPNGDARWVRDRAVAEKDADGKVVRIYGVTEDITESRELEHRFQQVQKMEAVGRLAAGVAHDFNNLLTVISGYTQLVVDRVEEPNRGHLKEVLSASDQAAALTRQLLAFSRKQVLAPESLELNELLMGMEKMLRRLVGTGVEVVCIPGRSLGQIHADPNQIRQVVMNLVVNARDAMPEGGRLTLETYDVDVDEEFTKSHSQTKPGPYVVLVVSDTGVGMDEKTRERIFEPFFTTKAEGKGTGLGLATVYGIVKQSGGDIFVYSEKGMGTSFKMYFPRLGIESSAPATKPAVETAGRSVPRTVLLVEDNPAIRGLLYSQLRAQGHTVMAVGSPEEALKELEGYEGALDLLITDFALPGMDGLALAGQVRALRPGLKVLLVSGYAESAALRGGALLPGMAFLSKPFGTLEVARKMGEILASA